MKLKTGLIQLLCTVAWFAASPSSAHVDQAAAVRDTALTKRNFERCTFDFTESKYLSREQYGRLSVPYGYESACIINLHEKLNTYNASTHISIFISNISQIDNIIDSQGFFKDKNGKWAFKGGSMGIFFVSFKKLSLDRIDNDQGTTLVGRQLENAKNQKGVLGVVDGVHILRITPSYLVSMDMPFFSTAPKEARDDIIKDMVNLVESVHVMTSP